MKEKGILKLLGMPLVKSEGCVQLGLLPGEGNLQTGYFSSSILPVRRCAPDWRTYR